MIKGLEWKKISELVDIFNNIRVPLSSKERENLNKMFPYYGAQGIVDYVDDFLFDGEYLLVAEDGENLRSNNQNICNLVKGKFWVNNHAHILKANDDNITKYLFYNFNRIKFDSYVTGSAQPKLNKENLLNIKTCVHSKVDQQKITSVLSALDDKIELNNRINSELEAMAKLLYEYWFVQFDFPYDFRQSKPADETSEPQDIKPYKSSGGKMVWNKDLNREIPEGWEVKNLEECLETIVDYRGKTPRKLGSDWSENLNDIVALSAKHVKNGKLVNLQNANRVNEELYEIWMKQKLMYGDILMTSEAPCGEFFYLVGKTNFCLSQRLFAIRSDSNIVEHSYLFFELSYGNGYSQILGKVSGSTVFGIRQDELRTVKVLIPQIEPQMNFSQKAEPIFQRIRNNDYQNQELSSLRDWLLPMLMNGQISVADAERVNEELGMVAEGELGRYGKK
jgi:type I restriction enzyme S subunit